MSIESDLQERGFYGSLLIAKDFSECLKRLNHDKGRKKISRLPLEQFIRVIEVMVKLHYNQFFAAELQPMLKGTRDKRKHNVNEFFDATFGKERLHELFLNERDIIVDGKDELLLGLRLAEFVGAIHSEKANQARTMSVLGSHLSQLFFKRLAYKKTEIVADMRAIQREKTHADDALAVADAALTKTKAQLFDAKIQLMRAKASCQALEDASEERVARIVAQEETIARLKQLTLTHKATTQALEEKAEQLTQETLSLTVERDALGDDLTVMRTAFKDFVALDDACMNALRVQADATHEQITFLLGQLERSLSRFQDTVAEHLASPEPMAAPVLQDALTLHLANLNSTMRMMGALQHRIQLVNDNIRARNASPVLQAAREKYAFVTRQGMSVSSEASLASKVAAAKQRLKTTIDTLLVATPQETLDALGQRILEGRYARDEAPLLEIAESLLANAHEARVQSAGQSDALADIKAGNRRLKAGAESQQGFLEDVCADIEGASDAVTRADAHVDEAASAIEAAKAHLAEMEQRLESLQGKIDALMGARNEALIRAERLRVFFEVDAESAKSSLRRAVKMVAGYLKSSRANGQLFVHAATAKCHKLEETALGLRTGGHDIDSITTVAQYLDMFKRLEAVCRLNRSMVTFGRKHLSKTPSSRLLAHIIDCDAQVRLDDYLSEQADLRRAHAATQAALPPERVTDSPVSRTPRAGG